ncbi:hypothetical protein ASPWEDRAFT_585870 [Aspergillus wentii DTO 134E9]|uniref:Uncharacterized protein n=1 Tax=Aspergillus wentii DTO 134E9 TaxID=1073089 RepID=A0A1L9RI26_ASPWE|nr:uncharacterized protein ASPWEDRAFT_585870 [Aspergillus wentii DTO 134E9]OJJ34574.1 hypothetical protein ASPWEDRAFT_585870 [Aspergillus wentii DTO 134E9]
MQEQLHSIRRGLDEKKKHCAEKDKLVEELKKKNDDCQRSCHEARKKVNIANGNIDKLQKKIKEQDKTIETMKGLMLSLKHFYRKAKTQQNGRRRPTYFGSSHSRKIKNNSRKLKVY